MSFLHKTFWLVALAATAPSASLAQDAARPYDPIDAGIDAYYYHEAQRRDALAQQLTWNQLLKRYPALPGLSGTTFYGNWPSRDYLYAAPYGERIGGVYAPGHIFTPWPVVAGDIWGYPYYEHVPQSIGQRQFQSGPNTWESHPVYPSDLLPQHPPDAAADAEAVVDEERVPPLTPPEQNWPQGRLPREF